MGKISDLTKERELLGLFLLSRETINTAIESNLLSDEFTNDFNKKTAGIILDECRMSVDFIPTINYIIDNMGLEKEKEKKDARIRLSRYKKMVQREIVDDAQIIQMVKDNIKVVRDCSIKRRIVNVLKNGLDSITMSAREWHTTLLKDLTHIEINDGLITEVSIHTGFKEIKVEMERLKETGEEFGYTFGLRDFDAMTKDQIAKGTLSYIVGRPSNYKTGLALNLAFNQAEMGIPAALFSCEMKPRDVYRRILSRITRIDMAKLKRPKELTTDEWKALDEAIEYVENMPLYVVDSAKLNVMQIASTTAYLKSRHNCEMIYIDYFQLIRTQKGTIPTEEGEFGVISEELRNTAGDFDVAVIALSQANRGCEQRDDKRPTMKDIRSTGKAEMDAHNIFYVYRDEFYYMSQSEVPNHLEVGALKVREGELRRCLLHFNGSKATLGNADPLIVMDKSRDYIGGGGGAN